MIRRNTNQKKLVYDCIYNLEHAKTEDIIRYFKSNDIKISLATIYRNLRVLEEDMLINKVKINEYEFYEVFKPKHYYFICTKCENIIDIYPNEIDINIDSIKSINKSDITSFNLTFYGVCPKCMTLKY